MVGSKPCPFCTISEKRKKRGERKRSGGELDCQLDLGCCLFVFLLVQLLVSSLASSD